MTPADVLVAAGYTDADAERIADEIAAKAQRGIFWALVEACDRVLDAAPRPKPLTIGERARLSEMVAQKVTVELVASWIAPAL